MSEDKELVFDIGLVMAGAISAGAYTAGVLDFLVEALEEWEEAKAAEKDLPVDERTIPYHKVCIKVVAGASAGGMTAAMLAARLRNKAVGMDDSSMLKNIWVDEIDIDNLLEDADFKDSKQNLRSILDSSKITEIAENAFKFQPAKSVWKNIPYIDENLKLYLTLSNLRGVPYEFKITGETGFKYGMSRHADYEEATINSETTPEEWERLKDAALATGAFPVGLSARLVHRDARVYFDRSRVEKKEFISIKFEDHTTYSFTCVDGGVLNNEPLELARQHLYSCSNQTAQAEEAIRNAIIHENDQTYQQQSENKTTTSKNYKKASANESVFAKEETTEVSSNLVDTDVLPYSTLLTNSSESVENMNKSAVIDENGHYKEAGNGTIKKESEESKYKRTLDRALILIDPFPNIVEIPKENDKEDSLDLFKVIPRLISALRNNALFKPEELLVAAHKKFYSSFMIAPVRLTDERDKANYPIASGFLGGFGGFFLRSFREHDYQLGRRNCQRFLERYFVVPASEFVDNPIFSGKNGELLSKYKAVESQYPTACSLSEKVYYPIIPLMGDKNSEEDNVEIEVGKVGKISVHNLQKGIPQITWPGYKKENFERFIVKVGSRVNLIVDKLLSGMWYGRLMKISFFLFLAIFSMSLLGFSVSFFGFINISNPTFLLYFSCLLMLIAGMLGTVAVVYVLIKLSVKSKIKSVLREQLQEYAFPD